MNNVKGHTIMIELTKIEAVAVLAMISEVWADKVVR